MENKKISVWMPLLFSGTMVMGMMIGYGLHSNVHGNFFGKKRNSSVQEAIELINAKYVDDVQADSLTEEAIEKMLSHLDPHSVYIPPTDLERVQNDMEGGFEGIGVEYQFFADTANVLSVLKDGPGDKAGMQTGDKFLTINDSVVIGKQAVDGNLMRKFLRGKGGSVVNLMMLRGNEKKKFTVERGLIPLPSVAAAYMLDKETGYIKLTKFSESTYKEFMTALEKLKKDGMKSLVFDLRDNGGGMMSEAVAILDEFLDSDKLLVYTEGKRSPKYEYRCKRDGQFETGKLVVLIDDGSASASEVVAGALQDYDRATIVGRRSFGKGLVQEQFYLSNGAGLRLTVARYYTPLGRSIQKSYQNGLDAYHHEVMDRLNDGELSIADSIYKPQGKVYTTKAGKKLYGGGGISPDVYVKYDTVISTRLLNQLSSNRSLSKFSYALFMKYAPQLRAYKSIDSFIVGFHPLPNDILLLQSIAAKDSIQLPVLNVVQQSKILQQAKVAIARYIWRDAGEAQVSNTDDAILAKAKMIIAGK
jgi:carboxyl-terminal processing protease